MEKAPKSSSARYDLLEIARTDSAHLMLNVLSPHIVRDESDYSTTVLDILSKKLIPSQYIAEFANAVLQRLAFFPPEQSERQALLSLFKKAEQEISKNGLSQGQRRHRSADVRAMADEARRLQKTDIHPLANPEFHEVHRIVLDLERRFAPRRRNTMGEARKVAAKEP